MAQDRANRSKEDKVIFRPIDMFDSTGLVPAWDDNPRISLPIERH
jgi:hypothetical protein